MPLHEFRSFHVHKIVGCQRITSQVSLSASLTAHETTVSPLGCILLSPLEDACVSLVCLSYLVRYLAEQFPSAGRIIGVDLSPHMVLTGQLMNAEDPVSCLAVLVLGIAVLDGRIP